MSGTFIEDDLDNMYDEDEFAVNATTGGNSFAVHFYLEDAPTDINGERVQNAMAHIRARTKHVADVKPGTLITIGTVPDDDAGSGLAGIGEGEMMIDLSDSDIDVAGIGQLYVIKISAQDDDGLEKQIFLSKDKP